MESYFFDKEITVDAVYFRGKNKLASYPKRATIDDQNITFLESGLKYAVRRGKQIIQMFDMTDGQKKYQLELDPEAKRWRLLHVAPINDIAGYSHG